MNITGLLIALLVGAVALSPIRGRLLDVLGHGLAGIESRSWWVGLVVGDHLE